MDWFENDYNPHPCIPRDILFSRSNEDHLQMEVDGGKEQWKKRDNAPWRIVPLAQQSTAGERSTTATWKKEESNVSPSTTSDHHMQLYIASSKNYHRFNFCRFTLHLSIRYVSSKWILWLVRRSKCAVLTRVVVVLPQANRSILCIMQILHHALMHESLRSGHCHGCDGARWAMRSRCTNFLLLLLSLLLL